MSVILDALHKARGDRRNAAAAQPHEQAVARVVDAGLAPQSAAGDTPARQGNGRGWILAAAVCFGAICLVGLIGGAFFLLYHQMLRVEAVATQPVTAVNSNAPAAGENIAMAAPMAAAPPPVLQTPVPLSELPVQAPAAAVAPAEEPDFELGSIVCENNDCIASLNNRSVREGDTVKGYVVTRIESTSITLKRPSDNSEITLSLFD